MSNINRVAHLLRSNNNVVETPSDKSVGGNICNTGPQATDISVYETGAARSVIAVVRVGQVVLSAPWHAPLTENVNTDTLF